MRKAILLLLAVVSSSAAAEWVKVGESDAYSYYIDPATIRKNGNITKLWSLFDYLAADKLPDGSSYLSLKKQSEYDCKEEKYRMLATSAHSKNMGGGVVVFYHTDPLQWRPVSPSSVDEILWEIACGKR